MKKVLNIIIKEIQIKTIIRYHHKPTRMAGSTNKNTSNH